MSEPGMVIVGAGEAGTRAALGLRECGFSGPIALLGEERHTPYERPPLSKAAMLADADPATIVTLRQLADHDIDFRAGCVVTSIDRAASVVRCAGSAEVPYRRLLLATGARPRVLSVPGGTTAATLRHLDDAWALRARLQTGTRLVIVGGGFVGLEIAAAAVARGCAVTVLEAASRVLMRGVPEAIADIVAQRHRAAGVTFRLGIGITRLEPGAVFLDDGSILGCDVILAGVGARPETSLAEACGLRLDNGIAVDDRLCSSDPAIYAAGDCCSYPSALHGGRRLRLEAWRHARAQGERAARNMAGEDAIFDDVPWFWSDQYDLTLQVAGLPDAGLATVRRDGEGIALFFQLDAAGRLVAASGVGRLALAKDIKIAELLIAQRATPDPAALASPSVRLRSLLAA